MLAEMTGTDEKQCRICGEVYPLVNFNLRDKRTGRRDNTCKACRTDLERERMQKRRAEGYVSPDTVGPFSPADPWGYLARAVVRQAIVDYRKANNKHSYLRFFASDWFECLCDLAGCNPVAVRERLHV